MTVWCCPEFLNSMACFRRDVSKRIQIKSFTVLSDCLPTPFLFNSVIMECVGLTSILSLRACAYMVRSMLADQPYSDVVRTHGESTILSLIIIFSTLSPSTSFDNFINSSNSAFGSSSFSSHPRHQDPTPLLLWISASFRRIFLSWCTIYSSTGSTM